MAYNFRVKQEEKDGEWFDYELEDKTIKIKVCFLKDEELSKIQGKSQDITWEKHQRKETVSDTKFKRNLVKSVLLDIDGAQVKDLQELIEPGQVLEFEGDADLPLKYDKEVNALLSEYTHYRFGRFLFEKSRELNDFMKNKQKESIENLGPGSGGKKDQNLKKSN